MNQCEFHGYDKLICPDYKKDTINTRKEQVKAGTHAYIISAWNGDGQYSYGNAVGAKYYKSKAIAERVCNKGNEESGFNRVVRFVSIPKESK
jgi:hypothetical protein